MPEELREELTAAMRAHERDVAQLSRAIATIEVEQAPKTDPQVVFLTAQILKHRISMALLASRLAAPLTLAH